MGALRVVARMDYGPQGCADLTHLALGQRAYFELEQLSLIKKHTGKDFLGKPRIDYRVA